MFDPPLFMTRSILDGYPGPIEPLCFRWSILLLLYMGVFDYDAMLLDQHDPIGRVVIHLDNFNNDTVYTLKYPLYHGDTQEEDVSKKYCTTCTSRHHKYDVGMMLGSLRTRTLLTSLLLVLLFASAPPASRECHSPTAIPLEEFGRSQQSPILCATPSVHDQCGNRKVMENLTIPHTRIGRYDPSHGAVRQTLRQ